MAGGGVKLPTSPAAQSTACAHCGLPVPPPRVESDREFAFCCSGCQAVYGLIHDAGLERFYALQAEQDDSCPQPAAPRGHSYAEFDDPSFMQAHVTPHGALRQIDLYLEGVHCAACVWLLEKLPGVLPGVASLRLDFGRAVATVRYDPQRVALSAIARRLDAFGYVPHPFRSADRRALARGQERRLLIRLGVAGAAAGNVMLIAVALYAGAGADSEVAQLFRWVSLAVTLPAVLWAGQTFFRGALAGLRARTLHMDVPVSLALIGATASSTYNTLRGSGDIYFDSVALLMFLLLVARWAQLRALRAASDASELLFSLAPSRARVVDPSGQVREVSVESLVAGQVAEVRAGESIPVDGTVIQGRSRIDNALLTGEPIPVEVEVGSEVHAGAHNLAARLLVRITAAGENTRVGRLLAAVSEAQRRRAPIVRLADRLAAYFVFAVLLLAGLSAALWWSAGPEIAAERAVSMLVVTCPCALGLATPLALAHALGMAARRGIFVKGADTVETLSRVDTVLLDKTGTLTHGRVALASFEGSPALVARVAALEQHSAHPFAQALCSAFPPGEHHRVEGVEDTAGAGVRGHVDGQELVVGSPAFVRRWVTDVPPPWQARLRQAGESGTSPVLVAAAGRIAGLITFNDPLRADTAAAVHSLRGLGLGLSILSGDDSARVAEVARQLRIDPASAQGGLTPEAKLLRVQQLVDSGRVVAMVGDGVNDAAALAAAQVGIAVRGGAELSLATADVFLTRPGLPPAVQLVRGARATLRVVHRNLGISLGYNLVGAGLALAGLVSPLVAAILMPLSSLAVIISSIASRPFGRSASGRSTPLELTGPEAIAWR